MSKEIYFWREFYDEPYAYNFRAYNNFFVLPVVECVANAEGNGMYYKRSLN